MIKHKYAMIQRIWFLGTCAKGSHKHFNESNQQKHFHGIIFQRKFESLF